MTRRRFFLIASAFVIAGCGKKQAQAPSENDTREFFTAVQDGDADIVRRLLQAKPGLANARNESGQTALQVAKGNEDLLEVLKKPGAKE